MSKYENNLTALVQAVHTNGRLYRNNVGAIKTASRYIEYGLCRGSSDLIGFTEIIITPEMVGKKIAIFTALEIKNSTGRPSKEQVQFIKKVNEAGGISGVIRNIEDYKNVFK
jgi:hypothetical protein